jgi:hypothetical protein
MPLRALRVSVDAEDVQERQNIPQQFGGLVINWFVVI